MQEKFLTQEAFDRFEDRLWNRFNDSDALTRKLGERVAVVEALANKSDLRLDNHSADTKATAAKWGGGIGTAAATFVWALIQLFHPGAKP